MAESDARAANRARWARNSASWRRAAAEGPPKPDWITLPLMDAVGAAPGRRIVDLASGTGDPAIPMAARVAPGGLVVATDQSPEMLGGARERAGSNSGPLAFVVAQMEDLPYPDRAFDGATCRFGIMFPADRVAAAAEARRVLKPGARAVYAVWGPLADNPMFAEVRKAIVAFSNGAAGTGDPQRHSLGASGALAAILTAAGFTDVEERELRTVNEVPADRPFWRRAIEGEFGAWHETLDALARAEFEHRVVAEFARYRAGDVLRLPAHARLGIGVAPG